jgi:ABC-2 type transport system permease protein
VGGEYYQFLDLSGVFFPIETMPEWIQPISNILPLTYFVDGLRERVWFIQQISYLLPFGLELR